MVKRINAIEGVFKTLDAMKQQAIGNNPQDRNEALAEIFDNIIVDTVCAFDTQEWETGISKDSGDKWIIVEQYENKDQAIIGHKKWVKTMKNNPNEELKDINIWG